MVKQSDPQLSGSGFKSGCGPATAFALHPFRKVLNTHKYRYLIIIYQVTHEIYIHDVRSWASVSVSFMRPE